MMFGLGFIEILIIFLAVIVFVNPKDMPVFFRKVGKVYQQIREFRNKSARYFREIEREIEKSGQELKIEQERSYKHSEDVGDTGISKLKEPKNG